MQYTCSSSFLSVINDLDRSESLLGLYIMTFKYKAILKELYIAKENKVSGCFLRCVVLFNLFKDLFGRSVFRPVITIFLQNRCCLLEEEEQVFLRNLYRTLQSEFHHLLGYKIQRILRHVC